MEKEKKKDLIICLAVIVAVYAIVAVLEAVLPRTSMLFTVLKKGSIYADRRTFI